MLPLYLRGDKSCGKNLEREWLKQRVVVEKLKTCRSNTRTGEGHWKNLDTLGTQPLLQKNKDKTGKYRLEVLWLFL